MNTPENRIAWKACCRCWWPKLSTAVLGLSVLCAASCRSITTTATDVTTQARKDIVTVRAVESVSFGQIPKETTTLTVDAELLKSLTALPPAFALTADTGRLHVRLSSDGQGGIRVNAQSDSIAQRIERKQELQTAVYRSDSTANKTATESKKTTAGRWYAGAFLTTVLLALILNFYIIKHF